MSRRAGLLPGLLLGAFVLASVHTFLGFVAPAPPMSAPWQRPGRSQVALRARGGARGWIAEVTGGGGDLPHGAM